MEWEKEWTKLLLVHSWTRRMHGCDSQTQWFSSGSYLKITANKEPNDCEINMMRLEDHKMHVCGANTALLSHLGVLATWGTMCIYVHIGLCTCVGHEWVTITTSPIYTACTSFSSSGISQLPCTYTPPSQTRELLFISLSLYLSSAGMSHQSDDEVCLSPFQLLYPTVSSGAVCLSM